MNFDAKIITMENCTHSKLIPIPDSLAQVCESCGKVWVDGQPWEYKSGNIIEWIKDVYGDKSCDN